MDQIVAGAGSESAPLLASIERLSKADPKNIQEIAGAQLGFMVFYHEMVLNQSRKSFFWALIGSGTGLLFFICATAFVLWWENPATALIPVVSGSVVEVVAGVVFYLYGRTTAQLSDFHRRLEVLQRHLLANSICEGLDVDHRNAARAELIRTIAEVTAAPAGGA